MTARLKHVATLVAGGTPDTSDPANWSDDEATGTRWVNISDMTAAPTVIDTERRLTPHGVASKRLTVGQPGTTLFAMYASVGTVAALGNHAAWNQAILGISSVKGRADDRFIRYLLSSMQRELVSMTRSTTQDNLNAEQVANLPFPDVAVPRQGAIADFLDAETARIDQLIEERIAMAHAVDDRFVASCQSVVGIAPTAAVADDGLGWTSEAEKWPSIPIKRLLARTEGGTWGDEPGVAEFDARCVRGTDFDMDLLVSDGASAPVRSVDGPELRKRCLARGDLIVEKSGGGETQPVGRVVEWVGDFGAVPTNFASRLRPLDPILSRYLTYLFRAAYATGLTVRFINQTTGIQNLDLQALLSTRWRVPDPSQAAQRARELDRLLVENLTIRDKARAQVDLLRERRSALITAAVTGQLAISAA